LPALENIPDISLGFFSIIFYSFSFFFAIAFINKLHIIFFIFTTYFLKICKIRTKVLWESREKKLNKKLEIKNGLGIHKN
jgi:hypothetical protein